MKDEPKLTEKQLKQLEEMKLENETKSRWREEMLLSPGLVAYLSEYDLEEQERFKESIISEKWMWHRYGEMYISINERRDSQWTDAAAEHLEYIQQKKLFNTQCMWRAEKIEIEGIIVTADFDKWAYNVLNCPFIEQISQDDLDLYIKYLLQISGYTRSFYETEWQDYEEIKETRDTEEENYPDWYEFFDTYRGTGSYLLFPDIRGQKELHYRTIYFEDRDQNTIYPPPRKFLGYPHGEYMEWYVKTFEDKQTQKFFEAYNRNSKRDYRQENAGENMRFLLEQEEYIPIEAHYDWAEALDITVIKYKNRKIAEALPEVFENYCMNMQMGIAYPVDKYFLNDNNGEIVREQILKGRAFCGEPQDFNF